MSPEKFELLIKKYIAALKEAGLENDAIRDVLMSTVRVDLSGSHFNGL